jgi:predicted O-methyltransferase YrrM
MPTMTSRKLVFSLTQTIKRAVWSNPLTRAVVLRGVDAAYLVRKRLGMAGPGRSPAPTAFREASGDLAPFQRYRTEFGWIGGWFKEKATASWDCLLALQTALAVRGNLMEIGVSRGKSAALMVLHARSEDTCVFVDPVLRQEAIDAIETIRGQNNVWLRDMSQNIRGDKRLDPLAGTFRWIHIDGEHSGRAVMNDLEIAGGLLSPEGVICLDDFMSPAYPQITMAAFRFLDRKGTAFSLFLNGFNKGYICRTAYAPTYLRFLKDQLLAELNRRELTDVTIWKTTDPDDMNCFGLTRKYLHYEYKGPDWAPDTTPI